MKSVGLPISVMVVLKKLVEKGPMTPKQLRKEVTLAPRTVSSALSRLIEDRLCKKVPNLADMRQSLYAANIDKMKELQVNFERRRAEMQIYMKTM